MTDAPLDLSQLALERQPQGTTEGATVAHVPRRKRWLTRYVLPLGILLGFLSLWGAAAGRRLWPQPSVRVVPVVVKRAAAQPAGTELFRSPGWIEPRPTAIRVAALAPGVIDELLVVEGQRVAKGEPIARLISIDAELKLQQAQHSLAVREAELNRARAVLQAARIRRDNPLHLKVQLADAESSLAKVSTELAKLPFLVEAAEARAAFARASLDGKQSAQEAIAQRLIQQAESELAASRAELQELRQRGPNLEREVDAWVAKVDALRRQLDLLVEETRQLREAEAEVQSAEALREEASLQRRQAELGLERMVVRAPMPGRVLRLVASPGTHVMGVESTAGQGSSTVVEMYDPDRLQVRADVRLEDVPLVTRGQAVEIETASSDEVIRGRVLQATSAASVQKNTLEVKVELIDPPPAVRPEMLVTATFLASPTGNETGAVSESERLFVPQPLVQSSGAEAYVWIVDADQRAKRRPVVAGTTSTNGLTEIVSGLKVTDKLIASGTDGLAENSPVLVTGDDQTMGIN